ncbi:hypothetical protein PybrP1_008677 [[Pythium] brassicae (nom. inval.)]|nr:hypothetical protein PybrP1_008677 [[Pythium] brassicae (nom. inval.)]
MELRNRNLGGRRDIDGRITNVSLGPTVYAGERYSKASERLKRQNKNGVDVTGAENRLLAPRFIGYLLALVVVFAVFVWLQYVSSKKRSRAKGV